MTHIGPHDPLLSKFKEREKHNKNRGPIKVKSYVKLWKNWCYSTRRQEPSASFSSYLGNHHNLNLSAASLQTVAFFLYNSLEVWMFFLHPNTNFSLQETYFTNHVNLADCTCCILNILFLISREAASRQAKNIEYVHWWNVYLLKYRT